jgi:hypothetical protein
MGDTPFLVAELACSEGAAEGFELPSQMHLTWTCFVLRSSRQCSHWVIGRPFFFISKRGRSKCLQEEDLWPLMQVSLTAECQYRGCAMTTKTYQAYFLSLIIWGHTSDNGPANDHDDVPFFVVVRDFTNWED